MLEICGEMLVEVNDSGEELVLRYWLIGIGKRERQARRPLETVNETGNKLLDQVPVDSFRPVHVRVGNRWSAEMGIS